ncbi:hypothetical protein ACLB1Q_33310 [Escherichia coli]
MSVSRLQTPAQRTAFEQLFIRPHTRTPGIPLRWIAAADILAQQALLRHPDFVVARMKGQYWQVREKVFDYEGRFCVGRTNYAVNGSFD